MLREGGSVDLQVSWTVAEVVSTTIYFDYCSVNKVDRARVHLAHVLATEATRTLIAFSNDA